MSASSVKHIDPFDTPVETKKREPTIDHVLAVLKHVWMQEPDLNLGALIWSAVGDPGGGAYMFMMKDEKMLEALEKFEQRMSTFKRGVVEGRRIERAAIVADTRAHAESVCPDDYDPEALTCCAIAQGNLLESTTRRP